jgi:TfoX/Sxy family transcriptional regulator of competence genes
VIKASTPERRGALSQSARTDQVRARERFSQIVSELSGTDGVAISRKRGFSSGGLLVRGKMFAVLRNDSLLLKLPEARVQSLIDGGDGSVFDAGKGRAMREWVIVDLESTTDWLSLAREARSFVSG